MRWSSAITSSAAASLFAAALALPLAARQDEALPTFVHKLKYAMGTVVEIAVYDDSTARASEAIDRGLLEMIRIDQMMSNFNPASELSRLNRSAYAQAQEVSPDLYRVIAESLKYSKLSGGEFDVTVGPLVDLQKAALRGEHLPGAGEQAKLRSCVGYEKVELIPPNEIRFHSPCLRIDLGSIGKGYAVDRAAEVLRASGIKSALINAGGSSIYAIGAPPGQSAWLVHLRDPSNKIDPHVMLTENSVSTSEQTPASLLTNESAGHIIDPARGLPLQSRLAVSIVANSTTASDALSTTLLLIGPQRGKELLQKLSHTAAIWVSPTGETQAFSDGPEIQITNAVASSKVQ
jgi:thiamine biosynthesis lipoprotein